MECITVVRAFSLYSVFSVHLFFISPSPHFCCSLPSLNTFYSLPLYCFKSAHLVSLASISLSPTHHASIPSLHTPKFSSSLSGFETRLFFSPVYQDTGVFLCQFYIAKFHTDILVLSKIILRTPVMLRIELIFNKFSNQPLIKLSIIYSVIFPKFLASYHIMFSLRCLHAFDTTYPIP